MKLKYIEPKIEIRKCEISEVISTLITANEVEAGVMCCSSSRQLKKYRFYQRMKFKRLLMMHC